MELFIKDEDYLLHKFVENPTLGGRPKTEYIVTTDVAKHLCMIQRNSKGMEARQYFIDAEKENKTPSTYLEAIKQLVVTEEARIEAEKKQLQAEKNRDLLIHQNKKYTASELAGELGLKSAIKLNKMLNSMKIQYKVNGTWKLYAKYEALDYAHYKQVELDSGRIVYQMRWTGKGRDFILNNVAGLL